MLGSDALFVLCWRMFMVDTKGSGSALNINSIHYSSARLQ